MKLRARPCMLHLFNEVPKSSEFYTFYHVLLKDGIEVTKTKHGYETVSDEFHYEFLDYQLNNISVYYITKE